ncbi:NAD(+) diphosphatase [Microbacterium betulae]|uniref:NAD(+) diphosphatase n=1 Tax=Microbacterium betulae TaxID=2981139 RepID=A0AA97FJZ5_9MICO|nr:NAD(+) diphosphatase [Microbacterium sp. AB]WOF24460.1 NAD(+) diphosphatase [Microbacterium sp. AB]
MPVHSAPLKVDRSAGERDAPGLLDDAIADVATRVLVVRGDRALLREAGGPALDLVDVASVPEDARWAFLGRGPSGEAVLLAAFPAQGAELFEPPRAWGAVRDVGALLPSEELDTLVAAVGLGRWLVDAPFCSACGSPTTTRQAGWSRLCDGCGREHFPRTDPAVIVAITSADGERLLLGANAAWQGRMYSCFAGFVEAGESLETTVHRELREEAGVRVDRIRYLGSQPWPYPRSLMLGFHAAAVVDEEARPDGTEIVDVRWFTREEIGEGLEGRGGVGLPGPVSIAHRLIRAWYEGE